MASGMVLGIALALISALCFASAGALQHSATRSVALRHAGDSTRVLPVLGLLRRILARRVWWMGLSMNVVGFLFHATALHLGSITVVQALLSVQLIFAVPIGAATARAMPAMREWLGAAAVCLGIMTLVMSRGAVPQTLERHDLAPMVLAAGAVLLASLVLAASVLSGTLRTFTISAAAGTGFSLTAVLIVIDADLLVRDGLWGLHSHWQLYALMLSGLVAAVVAQDAFASGSFPLALTVMTAVDPIVSWVWGALLFDQSRPTSLAALAGMAVSGVLIVTGVALLAYSLSIARV